jgi:deoxyxylulose-5-phosphate synthase
VGALNRYLARLMSGPYVAARKAGKLLLSAVPPLYEFARRFEEHAKGLVVPSTLFEEFGFTYIGPIDGHDLDSLIPTLKNITEMKGPRFLHVVTKKGPGLQARGRRSDRLPRAGKIQSRGRSAEDSRGRQAHLQPGVRRLVVRHGARRQAPGRDHARDA